MSVTRLPANWDVPVLFHDRLGRKAGRQRTMFQATPDGEGHLLIILHELPQPGSHDRTGLFFWRNPTGAWRSSIAGNGLSPLANLLDRYESVIDDLEERLACATDAAAYFAILKHGHPLRRAAENLKQALQAARESVSSDKSIITLRDRAIDIDRACELLVEDADSALRFAMAQQAEEQSRMSHELARSAEKLNRILALFVPLTAATSLFSMKLDSGFDTSSVLWFWAVVTVGLAIGLVLARSSTPLSADANKVIEKAAPASRLNAPAATVR